MASTQSLIQYLKNCYQADNREQGLLHFFSGKVEEKILLKDAEMLTGDLPIYPVEDEWAFKTRKKLQIYIKEKDLLLCPFFVCGSTDIAGKSIEVCCPLYLIPLSIEQREEDAFIRPAFESGLVNPLAIKLLSSSQEDVMPYEAIIALEALLSAEGFPFEVVAELRRILLNYAPKVYTEELLLYPTLLSQKQAVEHSKKGDIRVIPAAGVGVISKSMQTLGVLHELELLTAFEEYSPALNLFLGGVPNAIDGITPPWNTLVPAVLSESQERLLRGIDQHPAMLIIGPPGTGKSYTIAALAIDRAARGESVLIVSANNQAVDVVERKISEEFGVHQITVRAGGKGDYKRQLRDQLQSWLNGFGRLNSKAEESLLLARKALGDGNDRLDKKEKALETQMAIEKEVGEWLANPNLSIGKKILRWWKIRQLSNKKPIWEAMDSYLESLERLINRRRVLINDWFQFQRHWVVKKERKQLQHFLSALIARTSSRQEQFFETLDFGKIGKAFPVWLLGIDEVSHVLPMTSGMFDLVIIDEASQCDLASILPVLQRAKKLVVAGDPKQLRHVSFLSQDRQQAFARQYDVPTLAAASYDYREMSVLDVVSAQLPSQDQLVFLDEHYRSHPSIIDFSNQQFYEGQLRIMTAKPHFTENTTRLELVKLNGSRHEKGYNEVEATFIISKVAELLASELELAIPAPTSIGILSPFRAQADYLQKLVEKTFSIEALEKHQIMVGTAHAFQGEERDTMFLSFVVEENTHPSSFQHLNKTDVFNVSITRARNHQWLVTSLLSPVNYTAAGLLQRYLASVDGVNNQGIVTMPNHAQADEFANAVQEWLQAFDVKVERNYEIAGLSLDLLVTHKDGSFGVDLIGYPGLFEESFPIERYKILHRMDLALFALPYRAWLLHPVDTQHALRVFLKLN